MTAEFHTIIVGAGAMGSAAAYHLARDGRKVLLLEQFDVGHNRGSSHGDSRIIRLSYDHPLYIELSRQAYRLWEELEKESGQKLIHKTGGLDLGDLKHPALRACLLSMDETGVEHELLPRQEVMRRFPQFNLPDDIFGVYQADAGILSPDICVPLLARMAAGFGAEVRERSPVESISVGDRGIAVRAAGTMYRGTRLLIAAGPWAGQVLEMVGLQAPFTVTQEHYAFFEPAGDVAAFQPGSFPIFAFYGQTKSGPDIEFYGFPMFGRPAVKVAEHRFGATVSPDSRSFDIPREAEQRMRDRLERLIPQAAGEVVDSMTCLYTNTPDHHFIIDYLPGFPDVVVAAGFSGHGFKFAIALGRILADMLERQETAFPIGMFSLKRFQ